MKKIYSARDTLDLGIEKLRRRGFLCREKCQTLWSDPFPLIHYIELKYLNF